MRKRLTLAFMSVFLVLVTTGVRAAISVLPGAASTLTGNGSLSPATPGSALSGDLLLAQIVAQSGATITAPAGWSPVGSASINQNGVQQRLYYLNLATAPAASYTWTLTGNASTRAAAVLYGVRGAATADCSAASTVNCAGSYQSGSGNQITAPNIQSQPPTYPAGSLRLAFFAADSGSVTITPALQNAAAEGVSAATGGAANGVSLDASYYVLPSASNGDSQSAGISATVGNIGSTLVIAPGSLSLTCLNDDFNRNSGLGSDWLTRVVNGSFTPAIVNNRLRLTTANTNQSTAASLQRLFPASGNYVQVSFRYYGYGGSGADGIALILSDATVTPQPGGFGGSLGYAPKGSVPGFAGGWLGLGLDEYGNFSNRNDSGPCAPGVPSCATSVVPQSVAIRGSSNTYYWLRGTGTLATSVSNSTGHLYRITVDSRVSGRALVSVERDTTGTGSSFGTLINSFDAASASGQAAVPANFLLSLTGSTDGSTNTHEVDDLQVCAQSLSPIVAIDHYEFTVNGTPLTCTPATVSVRACMDAACTTTYSGNVNVTLQPAGGWLGGDTKTFPGSGASFDLRETVAGTYTLGVVANSSTPALKAFTQNASLCSINGGAMSANCALAFSDAGLLYTVPAQTSGVTSGPIEITAAKTDDATKTCVPAFAGVTRTLNFWSGYVDPAAGTRQLLLNGTALSTNAASPTPLAVSFDAQGKASMTLSYADAGRVSLNARYVGSAATGDSGLSMPGSATFPVVPYRLCVDSDDSGWQCPSASTACARYRKAGENFRLRVTAKAFANGVTDTCSLPTTPNYRQLGTQLSATVQAPLPGSDGSLGVPMIDIVAGGTATLAAQTQSEAGVFTFTATPAAATHPSYSYFGQTVPAGTSANFGRFYPAGFIVGPGAVLTNRGDLSCAPPNGFTYLGEPLNSSFNLFAVNTAGVTTTNYRGAFARLSLLPVAASAWGAASTGIVFGAKDNTSTPTLLNPRVTVGCAGGVCGSWGNTAATYGTAALSAQLRVGRASAMTENGPFNQAQFGFSARDPDGVSILNPNYVMAIPPSATAADGALLGNTVLRFGRMRVDNAYGSPVLALPVPATAQFWNGSAFQQNADDSCTQLVVPASVAISTTTLAALYCNGGLGLYGTLAGVSASMNGVAAGSVAGLSGGRAGLVLSRPAGSGGGYVDLALSVPDYLKFNWDGADQSLNQSVVPASCTAPGDGDLFDDNPRARIRFGVKRNDKVIYTREVY